MIQLETISFDGRDIMIVRDDLFPFVGGGNKSRKAIAYEHLLRNGNYNAIVTTGGIQSNHCRAIALMCAKNKWDCHIVFHGSEERFIREKGNALLVRMAGVSVEFVDAEKISFAMDSAMRRFSDKGKIPFYITGGGYDIVGGIAYVNAVEELKVELEKSQLGYPDEIFLACGTGSTQAGIVAGLRKFNIPTKVRGISIARNRMRALFVTNEFYKALVKDLNIDYSEKDIEIIDDYLFGGYELFTPDLLRMTYDIAKQTGVILDTTYSGKAFYGMMDVLNKTGFNGNVLFWHTGGTLNIQK